MKSHIYIILLLLLGPCVIIAQNLTAIKSKASLPTPRRYSSALWDGDDSIYIFGGQFNGPTRNEVLRYSITRDEIVIAGHLPSGTYGGFVARRSRGIYHFGGTSGPEFFNTILRYDIPGAVTTHVGSLPRLDWVMAGLTTQDQRAILFGGYAGGGMVTVDLDTLSWTEIGSFPGPGVASSAVWREADQVAILAGNYHGLVQYSIGNGTLTTYEYPGFTVGNHPSIVTYNGTVFMVGASTRHEDFGSHGLIRFEPESGEYSYVSVEGYPGSNEGDQEEYCGVYQGQAVVLAGDRIYMFGGTNMACGGTHADIWYIDL